METVIGPILQRSGGYAFDTWTETKGIMTGFAYRRIEDAHRDRNATIRAAQQARAALVCQTIDEFTAKAATHPGA
jgi:hypothetical protein